MNYIDEYTKYLKGRRKSLNTINSYIADLKLFLDWLEETKIQEIDIDDIDDYIEYLHFNNYAITSINRKLVTIRSYIDFLNDLYDKDIKIKIGSLSVAKQDFIDDMLENNDVRRILKAAEQDIDTRKRERAIRTVAIIYTLYYTGGRISEVLQLEKKDINKDSIVIRGKGRKYREILIPKKLKEALNEYVEHKATGKSSKFLFTGQRGKITRNTAFADIKYYTGQARGISKEKVKPHAFRHLYAQNLSSLGVPPVVISQLLGHSLNVTGLYMQVSKKELLKTINKLDIKKFD